MKAIGFLRGGFFRKKVLTLAVVMGMMTVLVQCASISQRWPENERKTEDRMYLLQQKIGNGLGSGELAPNDLNSTRFMYTTVLQF